MSEPTQAMTVRLSDELHAELARWSAVHDLTMAQAVRRFIKEGVSR